MHIPNMWNIRNLILLISVLCKVRHKSFILSVMDLLWNVIKKVACLIEELSLGQRGKDRSVAK